jgi:hypothetical protein
MDRRGFLLLGLRGQQRVLELSCERLYVRYVDARSAIGSAPQDEDASLWNGEPPTRIETESVADLFDQLERSLARADVLRVLDPEWLNAGDLRSRVDVRIEAFRRRGGRVERSPTASGPGTSAYASAPLLVLLFAAFLAVPSAAQTVPDDALRARLEAVIASAADLPADSIVVQVERGVVTISGSVLCEGCGGNATPGGSSTVQQSLGAVVRAVPGVTSVRFALRYRPR